MLFNSQIEWTNTISTGAVIAFATELYEKSIISKRKSDGLKLRWLLQTFP